MRRLAALLLVPFLGVGIAAAGPTDDAGPGIPDGGFPGFDGGTGIDTGLEVQPTYLDLGYRDMGLGDPALSGTFDLVNANTSTTTPIEVNGLYKPATPSCNLFSLNTNGPLPQTISPGASRTWNVTFTGTVAGDFYCHVDIFDTDGDQDFIDLAAHVVTPVMVVTPTAINFGSVLVGGTAYDGFTIQNNGYGTLVVSTIVRSGSSDFGMSAPTPPVTIYPFTSEWVSVSYTPSGAGSDNGSIQITGSDPGNTSDTVSLSGTGVSDNAGAHLVLSPSPVAFGNVAVGGAGNQSLGITNDGDAVANVTRLEITGTHAAQFTIETNCTNTQVCTVPFSVPAESAQTIALRCRPTSAGDKFATLTVTSNATNSPTSVGLTCTGTAADASVSPVSLNFGTVRIGSPSSSQSVTIRNLGNARLDYTLTKSGGGAADYTASPACTTTCQLQPGAMATIDVTFTPSAYGDRPATLIVNSNDPVDPMISVFLAGVGGSGLLEIVSPGSGTIDFGDIPITTTSTPQPLQIRNGGNMTLSVGEITVTLGGATFAITGTVPPPLIQLSPGSSHTVDVTCAPTAVMDYTGTIAIDSNAHTMGLQNVLLQCTGVDGDLAATPAPITFAPTRVGDSDVISVEVENIGGAAVTVDGIGATPGVFTLENGPSLPLALGAGASFTVDVRFTPAADGDVDGMFTVTSTGEPLNVQLLGPGRVASFMVEPDGQDFGTVCAGQSAVVRFTVTSTGSDEISMSLPTLTDPDDAFELAMIAPASSEYPATLAPTATATFDVVATPPTGSWSGTVDVVTDVSPGGTVQLPLDASAIAAGVALSPGTVDFATVMVGIDSDGRSVMLANCDPTELSVTAVEISGDDADAFRVGGTLPPPAMIVPTLGSIQWTVVFHPERAGAHAASLDVTTDQGQMSIPLEGIGETADAPDAGPGGGGLDTTSYYACDCRAGAGPGGAAPFLLAFLYLLLTPRRRRVDCRPSSRKWRNW